MRRHYRDQLVLGLIIAAIIGVWRLIVWLVNSL